MKKYKIALIAIIQILMMLYSYLQTFSAMFWYGKGGELSKVFIRMYVFIVLPSLILIAIIDIIVMFIVLTLLQKLAKKVTLNKVLFIVIFFICQIIIIFQ